MSLEVNNFFLNTFWQSLLFGIETTGLTLLLGYTVAYYLSKSNTRLVPIFLLFVILPFWVPIIIRYQAWAQVIGGQGVFSWLFSTLGISYQGFLYSNLAVVTGLVQAFLPFMILPLYNSLNNIDKSLIEGAKTLGASPPRAFYEITLPLSLPGIVTGVILVFILSIGSFLAPVILGGPDDIMIANLIQQTFTSRQNWPLASAMAIVYLCTLLITLVVFNQYVGLDKIFGRDSHE